ncbi:energy-coupling factor transporter transmembrane component T family protein [Aquibacillus salsiterrae]|uniref:Energy-coupling factor transporter transmembrane protein EcfT n=1 Tax=Aquibacillus salsiterrae TaxID=2950439 RepID=A0A9X4AFI6_9BACI|nr:energy-coupling factor transporter transmembrane component T [Aquibacillus salsiterrae]MDC3418057.1 energy-coupling factor transporter transmembrane protein EcfT [Aquibacillus salsiterrae]
MPFELSYRQTWLHKINPSFKFLLVIALFIYLIFVDNPNLMVNYAIGSVGLYFFFTGHPWKRLLLIALPFLLVFVTSSTSMIFFGEGEETLFNWGLVHITKESLFRGLHLGIRGMVFAILGVVFSLTTRPVLLFYSLMQQLKLKPKYAYSFMAAIRLLPIMLEELQTLRHALKVRGAVGGKGIRGFYEKIKAFAIPMLSQSIRRAHRIAIAMEAKRFLNVNNRTNYYQIGFSKFDVLLLLYFIGVGVLAQFASVNFPYFGIEDVRVIG